MERGWAGALTYADAWSSGLSVDRMRIQSSQERLQVWEEGILDGRREPECLFCRAEDQTQSLEDSETGPHSWCTGDKQSWV